MILFSSNLAYARYKKIGEFGIVWKYRGAASFVNYLTSWAGKTHVQACILFIQFQASKQQAV